MTDKEISSPDIILLGERVQQLDMLLHVQEFSAMSVLITGEQEIGKTSLLNAAAHQLSVHHQIIQLDAVTTQTLPDLIESVATSLGCEANLVDLDSHLVNMAAEHESLHILMDDAHLLDQEILQFLLEKSTLEHGWHLILCGDVALKSQLDGLQSLFENKLYHLIELQPLTEEESEAFISQVYKRSGVDVIPISLKDMHQLWLLSKGVPGKLLELLELEQEDFNQSSSRFPIGHMAAVVLIGSALVFSILYQSQESPQEMVTDDAIAQLVAKKQQENKRLNEPAQLQTKPILSEAPKPLIPAKPQMQPKLQTPESSPATALRKDDAEKQPKLAVRPTEQVVEKKPEVSKPGHPLMGMPKQSFALQLLGVRSEKSAKGFVARFSRQIGSDKLNIYETRYRGDPWFVVVYGPLDNKAVANEQAQLLSKTIKSQPWVRPISKIQDDIREIEQ